jgi:hypothetical protein
MEDVGLFYGFWVYFSALWSTLVPFGLFYGPMVYFMVIWYISSRFGMLCQEKSGKPDGLRFTWMKFKGPGSFQ